MAARFVLVFILCRIALESSPGKELSPWLFLCAVFILVPSLLYVSLSHLVFGAGCGLRLYRFLIIAFLSTYVYQFLVSVFKDNKMAQSNGSFKLYCYQKLCKAFF